MLAKFAPERGVSPGGRFVDKVGWVVMTSGEPAITLSVILAVILALHPRSMSVTSAAPGELSSAAPLWRALSGLLVGLAGPLLLTRSSRCGTLVCSLA